MNQTLNFPLSQEQIFDLNSEQEFNTNLNTSYEQVEQNQPDQLQNDKDFSFDLNNVNDQPFTYTQSLFNYNAQYSQNQNQNSNSNTNDFSLYLDPQNNLNINQDHKNDFFEEKEEQNQFQDFDQHEKSNNSISYQDNSNRESIQSFQITCIERIDTEENNVSDEHQLQNETTTNQNIIPQISIENQKLKKIMYLTLFQQYQWDPTKYNGQEQLFFNDFTQEGIPHQFMGVNYFNQLNDVDLANMNKKERKQQLNQFLGQKQIIQIRNYKVIFKKAFKNGFFDQVFDGTQTLQDIKTYNKNNNNNQDFGEQDNQELFTILFGYIRNSI